MLRNTYSFFNICREKNKLYSFVKNLYETKLEQIEDSLITSNDLKYSVLALENSRLLNPKLGNKLAQTTKLIFRNHDLSKLTSASFAVQILNALHLYVDEQDQDLYREIYKFYQKHPYLFDKKLINRLEYYFYQIANKANFKDIVDIDEGYAAVTNTRMYTPVVLDLYKIKLQHYWNVVVRYNPDKLTSTATLTHKSGVTLRIQGVYPQNFEDITDTKQLISDKKFDVVILNLPPQKLEFSNEKQSFNIIDKINNNLDQNKIYRDKIEQVFVTDYEPIIQQLKKKLMPIETKNILAGVQQGYEVPFTMESLIYQFYKAQQDKEQPIVILGGLNQEDRLKLYLNTIDSQKITQELQNFRMKWLNQIFAYVARAQKIGCFVCGTQSEAIMPPSRILDDHPILQQIQSNFLSDITLKYIGSSTKNKFCLVVHESLFYETLRSLVQSEIVKNDFDIDEYRSTSINQLLDTSLQNQKYFDTFNQFYQDTYHTQDIYKLCQQDVLNINKLSKLKYKPGIQIRCGVRDILL